MIGTVRVKLHCAACSKDEEVDAPLRFGSGGYDIFPGNDYSIGLPDGWVAAQDKSKKDLGERDVVVHKACADAIAAQRAKAGP